MTLMENNFGFENILAAKLEIELQQIRTEYEKSYTVVSNESELHSLVKRNDFPVMHVKQSKKKRTCQNMNGILGGSNAFNFLSFVAGVITLASFFCVLAIHYIMSLVAHRFGRYEFGISNICFDFFQVGCLKKNNNKYSKFDTSKSMSYQGHKNLFQYLFFKSIENLEIVIKYCVPFST